MNEAGDSIEINPQGRAVRPSELPKNQEVEKTGLDAILVFGQGPIIDDGTKAKAMDGGIKPGQEGMNFWSHNLAQAAAELYKRGQTREIIIMGGRTGGENYLSEAELIGQELIEEYGIPESVIKKEVRSTNTLENLVNVLNDYLDKDSQYKNLGILTSNYHSSRTRLLMELFGIPYKTAFSAEEVLRYVAREGEDWDHQKLLEIEHMLDMNEASKEPTKYAPSYFPQKQGTEKKDIVTRGQEEDVWSRALLEMPEYWIGYLGRLKNSKLMRHILKNQDQNVLKNSFGIDLALDTDEELKKKLASVERKLPNVEKWIREAWSGETQKKLDNLVEERNRK